MIFDMARHYGPRQDFGARPQPVFDREDGMGRPSGGINPGGMYTGGNLPPQVSRFQTGGNHPPSAWQGFARAFGLGGNAPPQVAHFNTGGNTPPVMGGGFNTGGPLPPMQTPGLPPMSTQTPPAQGNPWMTGGPGQSFMGPQSSLGRWFSAYRMGAYR